MLAVVFIMVCFSLDRCEQSWLREYLPNASEHNPALPNDPAQAGRGNGIQL
jgi:hypothetical protein